MASRSFYLHAVGMSAWLSAAGRELVFEEASGLPIQDSYASYRAAYAGADGQGGQYQNSYDALQLIAAQEVSPHASYVPDNS